MEELNLVHILMKAVFLETITKKLSHSSQGLETNNKKNQDADQ